MLIEVKLQVGYRNGDTRVGIRETKVCKSDTVKLL